MSEEALSSVEAFRLRCIDLVATYGGPVDLEAAIRNEPEPPIAAWEVLARIEAKLDTLIAALADEPADEALAEALTTLDGDPAGAERQQGFDLG